MHFYKVLLSFGAFSIPTFAAPAPANPFNLATPVCGPPSSNGKDGICVDHSAITSKPFAQYRSDQKHYLISQCKSACQSSKECKSIVYYNTDDYGGLAWMCELLSVSVTPYTIKCGDPKYGPGATAFAQNNSYIGQVFNPASLNTSALSNYFEKSCSQTLPTKKTSGTVPSADGDQLLCGAWTTTDQSYADLFMTAPNNTQTQCRDLCKTTGGCKSYWWTHYINPTSKGFGQQQQSEPEVNGDCALFSQPVREHGEFSEYPLGLFDINCNPGNGTY